MTNNEEAWDPRDNNRNDFDDTADSFAGQNEDAFANGDLDDDELKDDDGDYDNDLKPTYSQDDLDDDDEDNGPIELPDEGNDNENT